MTKSERKSIRTKMLALVKESEDSTMSAKDFITTKGIRPHIFYYWKRQYLNLKSRPKSEMTFLPISISEKQNTTNGHIEFFFSGGNRAIVKGDISTSTLRTLMGI